MSNILNYVALGKRIRAHRKSARLTQETLADIADISISFLGHIERGSRKASIETLLLLSRALNLSPNDLLVDSIPWTNVRSREMERVLCTQIQDMIAEYLQEDPPIDHIG